MQNSIKEREEEEFDLSKLSKAKGWGKPGVTLYQGCWIPSDLVQNVVVFQQEYQARDDDVILASHMKSGTTWLKALLFSVVNRHRYAASETPLLTSNPHELVPSPEVKVSVLHSAASPRLFSTHLHFGVLPQSIGATCRVVYICRNPLDTIASSWKFFQKSHPWVHAPSWTMEEFVETFCSGQSLFGPFWDHVLGFWRASLESPEKVLFLKYEEMLEDTVSQVKRIAEFLGFPFSEEEERSGVAEEIVVLCSLKSLKDLDVNKHGGFYGVEFKRFFGKGEIGDWVNHLSPSMVESVKKIVEEKLHGSGLAFKYLPG